MYIAGATQATDVVDPVKGVTVRTTAVSNGNTNLRPEKADTLSLGGVFRPRFLPGFSASVDYYNIRLKDAITTLAVADIVNRCAAGETAICSYVTRDSGGNITSILRIPVNLATVRVRGIDFDASYRMAANKIIPGLDGSFSLHVLATRSLNYAYTNSGITTEYVNENGGPNATYAIPVGAPTPRWAMTAIADRFRPRCAACPRASMTTPGNRASTSTTIILPGRPISIWRAM
jgi:outer membrane receptor protein involved in Fe transport